MVKYEDAKKKAVEIIEEVGLKVNWAGELPDAYVFNDTMHEYDGLLPMIIRKSDGKAVNYWQYLNQADVSSDDIKEIKF